MRTATGRGTLGPVSDAAPYFVNHHRRSRFPWSLYHRELETRLARALGDVKARALGRSPRVLVVGCGLEPFVPGVDGVQWHGVDLDVASIEVCRRRHPEMEQRLSVCSDAYALPSGGSFDLPFDAIVAKEVIEHLEDPRRWARVLAERLAPGGDLLLTTPNYGRFSTLPLLEASVLELLARLDGYSRKHIHPSRFDLKRFSELDIGPDVQAIEVRTTRTGWALFGRWQKAPGVS